MSKTPFNKFEEQALPKGKHWREAFDGRYLRVFWLAGKPRIVTITAVAQLKSSNKSESKKQLLITLAEAEKKWAANVTNCSIIEMLSGSTDPTDWVGMRITLYPTKTRDPSGQIVDCIRVREELPAENARTEKPKHRQEVSQYIDRMAKATTLGDLAPIVTQIGDDEVLTREEAAFLLAQLERRQKQLTPGEEAAQ